MYLSRVFVFAVTLLCVWVCPHPVSCVTFRLSQGEELCLSEFLQGGDLVVGEFTLSPLGARVQLNVYDPKGNTVHTKLIGQTPGGSPPTDNESKFALTASSTGTYKTCFLNNIYSMAAGTNDGITAKTITFSMSSGLSAKDYSAVAKKDSLKPIEIDLKRLEDVVATVHNDLKYLSEREKALREVSDSTGRQVLWFSVLSILVLAALKAAEIVYLKKYFQAKKLIN